MNEPLLRSSREVDDSPDSSGSVAGDSGPAVASSAVRYLVVGGGSALIELVIFQLLFRLTGVVALANPVAVVIATLANFAFNRSWAFESRLHVAHSGVRYLLLFAFNLAFSTWAIAAMVGAGVLAVAAKLLTMACITVWNFVLYRKVIFR
ncbi:MAG: polysaccharide biosynthesis protein GtrA [Actinobacteria bacterium HGW-Actinobacteria-7]|jgi:putative flippase GtrA|nr:MAG: polysaccharide biosynthesis protein GtrA [Actinobacteria bacterium HGW-Actinobacteria-7]